MLIQPANMDMYENVRSFYHRLIDEMEHADFKPGWEKDVYPSNDYLRSAILGGELYVGTVNEEIVAAMIVNHAYNESYNSITWPTSASEKEIMVIHALGVLPSCAGQGYAKQLVRKALEIAADKRQKVVRLDVLNGNLPAVKLYTGMGFQYVDTISMFYEDTGWTDFLLYEYPL